MNNTKTADILQRLEEYVATNPHDVGAESLVQLIREHAPGVISDAEVLQILRQFRRESAGFGALEELFAYPQLTDIVVNGTHGVYVDCGAGLVRTDIQFDDDAQVRRLATRLIVAAGRRLDDAQSYADGMVHRSDGTAVRVHAILAPPAQFPCLSLRILGVAQASLSQLVASNTMSAVTAAGLRTLVERAVPFVIIGGTGSGKTTLLSALLAEVSTQQRIIGIEDTPELAPNHPHFLSLIARNANVEGQGSISLAELLQQALRMRPNRIIVGEIRGREIVDLLSAMNTGHQGCAGTLHANALSDALARIEALAALGGLPAAAVRAQVLAAAPYILVMQRSNQGRRLTQIGKVQADPLQVVPIWEHTQGDFQP